MFGNLGLHVLHNPAGTYSYVGTIPVVLATEVPATTSDVLGCRSHRGPNGELLAYKFPVFKTYDEAVAFAESKGCTVIKD